MKKTKIDIAFLTLFTICNLQLLSAQAPQGFNYQGVARDNNGNILKSQTLGFRVSILADSTNGTAVYSETHTVASNSSGVFELVVGQGTVVSGNFSMINWGSASHFLKTEMDAAGGTNYVFYGTTQLMSVPYAMFAEKAGSSFNDEDFEIINATDYADAPVTACNTSLAGLGAGSVENGTHDYKITFITQTGETMPSPASNSVTVIFNATDGKISLTNIPVSSDNGVISRKIYRRFYGAGVEYKLVDIISDNVTTTYIDSLDYFSLGDTLQPVNTTKTKFVLDASSLNANRIIKVPDKSGTMALMSDLKADSAFLNELIDSNITYITNNTTNINSNTTAINNNTTAINNDADVDSTNELQTLSLSIDTLSISKGNYVTLPTSGMPIGAVIAWLKNLAGVPALPDGFVECNGQVLNDSLSPLNAVPIPDLNGATGTQKFLRGDTISGGTGGSETHSHMQTDPGNWVFGGASGCAGTNEGARANSQTNVASTLPSYYEVVWIMRVK